MVSILAGNGLGCDQPLKAVAASLERLRKDDTAPAGVTFVQLRCELERLKQGLVVRGIDHSEYLLCRTVDDDKGFGRRGTGRVIIASNDKLDKTVLTIPCGGTCHRFLHPALAPNSGCWRDIDRVRIFQSRFGCIDTCCNNSSRAGHTTRVGRYANLKVIQGRRISKTHRVT